MLEFGVVNDPSETLSTVEAAKVGQFPFFVLRNGLEHTLLLLANSEPVGASRPTESLPP